MSVDTYFQRYAIHKTWIENPPSRDIGLIVTIPVFNEVSVIPTLQSLHKCHLPSCQVEVIAVVNGPENASEDIIKRNRKCYDEALRWAGNRGSKNLRFHIILAYNLAVKDHGVGLARKIGMDEALRRFASTGNISHGIISCFDADSICLPNYLEALYQHFQKHTNCPGVSIYFEHDLNQISDLKLLAGIIQYELHLRYYIQAQEFTGFPHAHHTVGSSIAVRAEAYYKQGGMNKRKAGEDFYFLHKFIALGNFMDLTTTSVFPAARVSDRVPFGTGRALSDWMKNEDYAYFTYNPQSFLAVKTLFSSLNDIYTDLESKIEYQGALSHFLEKESFDEVIKDIKSKTRDFLAFKKRFYGWFNAFKMMKFLHFCRDHYFENVPVEFAAKWLLKYHHQIQEDTSDLSRLLEVLRKIDKKELDKIGQ